MNQSRQQLFRALASVSFSIGVVGVASGFPASWTVLCLTALSAPAMLALLTSRSLVPLRTQPDVEVAA
jgi:hypothetical protein